MTNRRGFLVGIAATAAGLLVPPTPAENAEEVTRRYWPGWAPPRMMVPDSGTIEMWLGRSPSDIAALEKLRLARTANAFCVTAPDGSMLISGYAPAWGGFVVTDHHPDVGYTVEPDGSISVTFLGVQA